MRSGLFLWIFVVFFNQTDLVTFRSQMSQIVTHSNVIGTAYPIWGDIFEKLFQSAKLKV